MEKILNFIGGEFIPPANKRWFDKEDPARGVVFTQVPDSDAADVQSAVTAAQQAFPAWSKTPAAQRAALLQKLAQLIHIHLAELAEAESRDTGKPITLANTLDIPRAQANFEFFASAIMQFHGETFITDQRAVNVTEYTPLGVVACISPWNLPLYLLSWKLAPALAAGNCVVAKPSEVTPSTAFLLSRLVKEAGFPKGVLNIVHGTGPGIGTPLTTHPHVKAISFTGSTVTGRAIAAATAGTFKKLSLEMGGKNANIIFADADFETAVRTTVRSSFANQGQICLCGSRILVEASIYEKFKNALLEKTLALKLGDPKDPATEQGSLVSRQHWDKVKACLSLAKAEGGQILCGGKSPTFSGDLARGYFMQPTLIEGLSMDCKTNQEEIFGPVATITPFHSEAEAISLANNSRYGLSASVWTRDSQKSLRVSRALESGLVWINTWMLRDLRTPFGGVKESGLGREGGMEALKFFSEVKNICLSTEENLR